MGNLRFGSSTRVNSIRQSFLLVAVESVVVVVAVEVGVVFLVVVVVFGGGSGADADAGAVVAIEFVLHIIVGLVGLLRLLRFLVLLLDNGASHAVVTDKTFGVYLGIVLIVAILLDSPKKHT